MKLIGKRFNAQNKILDPKCLPFVTKSAKYLLDQLNKRDLGIISSEIGGNFRLRDVKESNKTYRMSWNTATDEVTFQREN